jgi:POT family proton-dependent oligopeptide transporter
VATTVKPSVDNSFFGHPKGLAILFLTEMWERMSYYGMRSLLVLYMVNFLFIQPDAGQEVLGFNAIKGFLEGTYGPLETQPFASHIYGLYTGLVYFTPFFGGIIADRWLGQKRSVILGGILMTIGHFLMAFNHLFFVALLFLILGNGAFKPNISTQVGDLYPEGDPRRDGAFTLFYMGINLGAFFSPLVCGTLGQQLGWHYGFGAAGVGMILGLCIYIFGQKHLGTHKAPRTELSAKAAAQLTSQEKKAVWALMVLCALNVVFWGVYEQQGNTMQLWADEKTDWNFFGWNMPSTWYQSFNPLMIFIFAPLLNIFWKFQASRGKEPTSVTKMAIGCFILGIAFIVMILAGQMVPEGSKASVNWLLVTTFFLTIGELYLSPIGLSLVSKVAPVRMVNMLMGMWFLSSFVGNYLSGFLGTFYSRMDKPSFFGMLALLSGIAAIAMFAFNKPLRAALGNR